MTKSTWLIACLIGLCVFSYGMGARAARQSACSHEFGPWLKGDWEEEGSTSRIRNCGLCGKTDMEEE